jgi:bifunctional DNA-binding transcriptional regulator/antitoxin component of YhaV-PrlF toxin-antitoxin module
MQVKTTWALSENDAYVYRYENMITMPADTSPARLTQSLLPGADLALRAGDAHNEDVARYSDNRANSIPSPARFRNAPTKKVRTKRPKPTIAEGTGAAQGRTPAAEPSRAGKRGTVVIPAALRRRYGIEEGTFVIAEPREGGVLIRSALILPVEAYTPERKAQCLSNTIDAADYADAVTEVRAMGLDPDRVPHYKPPRV